MTDCVERILPRSAGLPPGERRLLGGVVAVLAGLVALTVANAIGDLGGAGLYPFIRHVAAPAIYVLVAVLAAWRAIRISSRRVAFLLFALGVTLYATGNIVWSVWIGNLPRPPIPSICDALWLSLYPLAAIPLISHASARYSRPPLGVVLDGLLAGVGLTAVGAALSLSPVLRGFNSNIVANATELAYPLGDLLLVGLTLGIIALRGWQLDRALSTYGGGFLLCAVADFLHATEVTDGASSPTRAANLFYVLSVMVLALSAWQTVPQRERRRPSSVSILLVPSGFTLTALGLIVWDRIGGLNVVGFSLAAATLLIAAARMMVAFRDVAGLAQARHLAATDELTSLPNRRQFMAEAEAGLAAIATSPARLAVLLLDLDNFKQLNDTLGHHAGDGLLRLIGPRLRDALRPRDVVARLGGDEFAILLCPAGDEAAIAKAAGRVVNALRDPFSVHGLSLRVTGSVGIAVAFGNGPGAISAGTLMQNADVAMYEAKRSRNGYEFYARERDTHTRADLTIGADLARAIERRELEVWFQPKARVADGRLIGAEALVRWRRDGRMVAPLEFIGAAERAGLARPLTALVLDEALRRLAGWRSDGLEVDVSVNTTVADLLDEGFPGQVAVALARHRVPAGSLVLEITETSVLADPVRIGAVLDRLRGAGVRLSLDDFGTGYSSLAHLRNLAVDELKIDRSFVGRMITSEIDAAIVYSMVALGRTLGIQVVAEGVEDRATFDALRALDCDVIQGYLISRPVTAPEMSAALAEDRVVRAGSAVAGF